MRARHARDKHIQALLVSTSIYPPRTEREGDRWLQSLDFGVVVGVRVALERSGRAEHRRSRKERGEKRPEARRFHARVARSAPKGQSAKKGELREPETTLGGGVQGVSVHSLAGGEGGRRPSFRGFGGWPLSAWGRGWSECAGSLLPFPGKERGFRNSGVTCAYRVLCSVQVPASPSPRLSPGKRIAGSR